MYTNARAKMRLGPKSQAGKWKISFHGRPNGCGDGKILSVANARTFVTAGLIVEALFIGAGVPLFEK